MIGKAKSPLKKRIEAIRQKIEVTGQKLVSQKCFLQWKQNKKVKGILEMFPDIGKTIEE